MTTSRNLPAAVKAYIRSIGSKGGKARSLALSDKQKSVAASKAVTARWRKTTKAERSEAARKAVQARWNKIRT
jgi:hypothetical protein